MKIFFLITLILMCGSNGFAQDVVQWNFSAKKIADKVYEVHFTPAVQSPWHIYSQSTPEGGAVATSIQFSANPLLVVDDKPMEIGKVVTKHEDVFGVDVKYLDGKVDFVQTVKLKAKVKTNVNGSITYMACKNEECLPPQTVKFNIKLE